MSDNLRIEELFNFIDRVLGLHEVSNLVVLILSATLTFTISAIILYKALSNPGTYSKKSSKELAGSLTLLYILSLLFMTAGLAHSIYLRTVSALLVLGLIIYVLTLTFTSTRLGVLMKKPLLLLFYLSAITFVVFFSSKVLINGVDATETTTDTLQIYHEGRFYFSRHAGWYDLAPVDAMVKNFLMYILGIVAPYDPVTTTLMFSALSVSILIALLAFTIRLNGKAPSNLPLAVILFVAHPYTLFIGMSTPPTNFSLTLSLFTLLLISKIVHGCGLGRSFSKEDILAIIILVATSTLAHPMSIAVPIYLLAMYFYEVLYAKEGSKKTSTILILLVLCSLIFALKAIYTGLREGLWGLIKTIIEGLTTLLVYEIRDINVYVGGPQPPRSSLFSFGAFPAVIASIFFVEVLNILKKRRKDYLTVLVSFTVIIMSVTSVFVNIVNPASRYIGHPAMLLGAFYLLIYLSRLPQNFWRKIFIVLLGVLCLASITSPNAVTEHYNIFTGGRWPRIENFILSEFMVTRVDIDYVIDVFTGYQTPRLSLYFKHDILLYGHPYHHINTLLIEKFLIPGVIKARSYWDFAGGRLFVKYEGYIDFEIVNRKNIVFSGWRWIATWD